MSAYQSTTELYVSSALHLQETGLDWQVAMAAATAADKSAIAAAAAGGKAAQLAVRRFVFEGMTSQPHAPPRQLPQAVAQPSQPGRKPCNKPRSRVPLVRPLSRQAARQVKPMPMRTLSDADFESALQPPTAQAEAPAVKRPPPPSSCYHPHPAAANTALQPAPALQPPRATQQPPWVTARDQVPPPATALLRVAPRDQALPPDTVSLPKGTPAPAQGTTGAACKTVSFSDSPLAAPQQQPQQMVQDGNLQVFLENLLGGKLPPPAQGSPSAAGRTLTVDGITWHVLPAVTAACKRRAVTVAASPSRDSEPLECAAATSSTQRAGVQRARALCHAHEAVLQYGRR